MNQIVHRNALAITTARRLSVPTPHGPMPAGTPSVNGLTGIRFLLLPTKPAGSIAPAARPVGRFFANPYDSPLPSRLNSVERGPDRAKAVATFDVNFQMCVIDS